MSTRSSIAMRRGDGKFVGVYCHSDGYLSHNGKILQENYNTYEKVEELLKEGDMSFLDKRCDKPEGHTFENPVDDHTVYYGRDRGESDVDQTVRDTYEDLLSHLTQEYDYLFDDGKWTVRSYEHELGTDLLEALNAEVDS